MDVPPDFVELGASLAIGLLIGTERGWHQKDQPSGSRAAGIRTFALIGLLGGVSARLAREWGPAVPAVAFAALAAVVAIAYAARLRARGARARDATTEVAALVTLVLGAGPPAGLGAAAGTAAVVVTALLAWKQRIHRAVAGIEERELDAGLKLLALAFVVMPVLPAEAVGPWHALRLREVLWMVLLVAGLSFAGYVAVKRAGARAGLSLEAVLGGFVSSTAIAVDFSKRARANPSLVPLLAAGIVGAGGTMFARVIALAAVARPSLLPHAAPALGAGAVVLWGIAFVAWLRARAGRGRHAVELGSPLALGLAAKFALVLAAVSVVTAGVRAWIGDRGVYLVSFLAGIGDVDAITLALSRQAAAGLDDAIAADGILIASATDTVLKAGIALWVGGRSLGARVAVASAVAMGAGLGVHLLAHRWGS